jgi:hypothetical protein
VNKTAVEAPKDNQREMKEKNINEKLTNNTKYVEL